MNIETKLGKKKFLKSYIVLLKHDQSNFLKIDVFNSFEFYILHFKYARILLCKTWSEVWQSEVAKATEREVEK